MKKYKTPTRTFNPLTGITTVTFGWDKDSLTTSKSKSTTKNKKP
jgi:hypothetical protein